MINFKQSDFSICAESGDSTENVELVRSSHENTISFSVRNLSASPVRLREIVVLKGHMPYPPKTRFYGEGFSMLSQYSGTLERVDLDGSLGDFYHYKLPRKDGFFTCYNLLLLSPEGADAQLAGFSSCRRFTNEIRFNEDSFEFVIDCDHLKLAPGEAVQLEDFFFDSAPSHETLLAAFASEIEKHHPRMTYPEKITGWCSWYCYGPAMTEKDIEDNMVSMKQKLPELRFIQIDDGYQAHMGDWLIPHKNFPNGVKELCLKIKSAGLEPAIWVSPFIAEPDSVLFQEHPDWFLTDDDGNPLSSSRDSFGGWRAGPWYMLDGSNPEALEYLRFVFRTMRNEWKCKYFKLDAAMWGCLPFGNRKNPAMTRVEAYRAGMRALAEGAGEDSIILGCNAPMWPSIGVCNAMRTTGDISRNWTTIKSLARECFLRNWQNNRLWINDPDCLVLENLHVDTMGPDGVMTSKKISNLSKEEFSFHRAHILASGGMLLSSDKLPFLTQESVSAIHKMLECYGHTAEFSDLDFRSGTMLLPGRKLHFLFNWNDTGFSEFRCPRHNAPLKDFWTDELIPESFMIRLPARSARVLEEKI